MKMPYLKQLVHLVIWISDSNLFREHLYYWFWVKLHTCVSLCLSDHTHAVPFTLQTWLSDLRILKCKPAYPPDSSLPSSRWACSFLPQPFPSPRPSCLGGIHTSVFSNASIIQSHTPPGPQRLPRISQATEISLPVSNILIVIPPFFHTVLQGSRISKIVSGTYPGARGWQNLSTQQSRHKNPRSLPPEHVSQWKM